jgi:hypothetical protein
MGLGFRWQALLNSNRAIRRKAWEVEFVRDGDEETNVVGSVLL